MGMIIKILHAVSNSRCNISRHTCGNGYASECRRKPFFYCRCAPACPTCKSGIFVILCLSDVCLFYPTAGVQERNVSIRICNNPLIEHMPVCSRIPSRTRDMKVWRNRDGRRGRPWPREREGPAPEVWEGFTGPVTSGIDQRHLCG